MVATRDIIYYLQYNVLAILERSQMTSQIAVGGYKGMAVGCTVVSTTLTRLTLVKALPIGT